ncbi:MAG: hypothetical protein ABW199_12065 [Caulobacterales bacterium]
MKKLFSALCALALVFTASAPAAMAHDRGYGGGYHRYDRRDNHDDAVAAGVIGLAIGALIGSAASRQRNYAPPPCYNCGGPPPPPPCYDRCGGYRSGYYDQDYYAPQPEPRTCYARERQWDPYAGRYLMIERPYPC